MSRGQSRAQASAAARRSWPLTWLRRRLGGRPGLSRVHSVPASKAEVLERLVALPVSTWSYGWDDDTVKHLGPMAQDFAAAFGLGDSERVIHTADGPGVCMAAIQAMYARMTALEAEVALLRAGRTDA